MLYFMLVQDKVRNYLRMLQYSGKNKEQRIYTKYLLARVHTPGNTNNLFLHKNKK